MIFYYILPIALIFCTNEFYNIGAWWHVSGIFNISDIGNVLLVFSLIFIPFIDKKRNILLNPISPLILFYMLFVFVQIFLAKINFGQSFFDGLVGVRHQFYYLSFFLFLVMLDDIKKITRLLDILVVISIFSIILSLINYFTPITVFSHKWSEGHGIRSSITRAYIPGMPVVSFSVIWTMSKWLNSRENTKLMRNSSIFLLFGHFFRQTRMRLVGVVLILLGQLLVKRRMKSFLFVCILGAIAIGFIQYKIGSKIMTQLFSSAYQDVTEIKGTMVPRMQKIKVDLLEFKRHPWIGSGVSAMRSPTKKSATRLQLKMKALSNRADLGYSHWLKFYGITGILWLILFFVFQVGYCLKTIKYATKDDKALSVFTLSYLIFVMFSFATLNHLMTPPGILLLCLNISISIRLYYKQQMIVEGTS